VGFWSSGGLKEVFCAEKLRLRLIGNEFPKGKKIRNREAGERLSGFTIKRIDLFSMSRAMIPTLSNLNRSMLRSTLCTHRSGRTITTRWAKHDIAEPDTAHVANGQL